MPRTLGPGLCTIMTSFFHLRSPSLLRGNLLALVSLAISFPLAKVSLRSSQSRHAASHPRSGSRDGGNFPLHSRPLELVPRRRPHQPLHGRACIDHDSVSRALSLRHKMMRAVMLFAPFGARCASRACRQSSAAHKFPASSPGPAPILPARPALPLRQS